MYNIYTVARLDGLAQSPSEVVPDDGRHHRLLWEGPEALIAAKGQLVVLLEEGVSCEQHVLPWSVSNGDIILL